jgi:hypothetical protein
MMPTKHITAKTPWNVIGQKCVKAVLACCGAKSTAGEYFAKNRIKG